MLCNYVAVFASGRSVLPPRQYLRVHGCNFDVLQCTLGARHGTSLMATSPAGSAWLTMLQSNLLRQCLAWFEDKDDRLACVDGLMQRSGKYFPEAAEQVCASIRSQPDPDFYEMCMLSFHNGIYGDLKSYDPYLCLAAGR